MTTDDDLYDPYEKKKPSSAGIPALLDPADRENPDRPLRTDDLIPRHGSHKTPKIWLPDGLRMEYYPRPSGWGECADNSERLAKWRTRKTVEGYLDTGAQGKTLRGERSVLAPPDEDKDAHDKINDKALRLVFTADREGTLKHTMTEKYDLGIPFIPDEEYEYVITEWVRLTKYFQIVDQPTGAPGVECFVAMDVPRLDQYGQPMFYPDGTPIMIRAAGTFDRIFRYTPCVLCGCRNYAADLKTSSVKSLPFAQRKSGIQIGIYANAKLYRPWADGLGADRFDLPDVCKHRGIIISIPPDGPGRVLWIDIARGYERAVSLIPMIKDHQKENNWQVEFTAVPNVWTEIDRATTHAEVQALWRQYPGEHWTENDGALSTYASNRITTINRGAPAI